MRQVNHAELVWAIKYRLTRMSATLRARFAKHDETTTQLMAEQIVNEGLGRYEVLSSAPLPERYDGLHDHAAYGTGNGSAPSIQSGG